MPRLRVNKVPRAYSRRDDCPDKYSQQNWSTTTNTHEHCIALLTRIYLTLHHLSLVLQDCFSQTCNMATSASGI